MDRRIYLITIALLADNFALLISAADGKREDTKYNVPDPDCTGSFGLCTDADKERLGYEAIRWIHEYIDDDKDGRVEPEESIDFIIGELKEDKRHGKNAGMASSGLTVDELWLLWKNSSVCSWTTKDVMKWINRDRILSSYVKSFERNEFDGRMTPRLAANLRHYLDTVMQIKDNTHKRRLILKSMDIVLFGHAQRSEKFKDIGLVICTVVCLVFATALQWRRRSFQASIVSMQRKITDLQEENQEILSLRSYSRRISFYEVSSDEQKTEDYRQKIKLLNDIETMKKNAEECMKKREELQDMNRKTILYEEELNVLRSIVKVTQEKLLLHRLQIKDDLAQALMKAKFQQDKLFDFKRNVIDKMLINSKNYIEKANRKAKSSFLITSMTKNNDDVLGFDQSMAEIKKLYLEMKNDYKTNNALWLAIASMLDTELQTRNNETADVPDANSEQEEETYVTSRII